MKTNTASLLRKMGLCLFASLLTVAAASAQVVLYSNDFSNVGTNGPAGDGWQYDGSTLAIYGSYTAYPVGGDIGFKGLGAWSHSLTTAAFENSIITIAMTMESEYGSVGGNGGFGLSGISANNTAQFTADGPRMAWLRNGATDGNLTFTMTGPVYGGSVSTSAIVPSNINDYWLRANLIMEINTTTGIAQGYYSNNNVRTQVITDFNMKGTLTATGFNDLFTGGYMQYFGGKFDPGAAENAWIDNISITAEAVPEPSTYALVVGGIATLLLIRRRVQS